MVFVIDKQVSIEMTISSKIVSPPKAILDGGANTILNKLKICMENK